MWIIISIIVMAIGAVIFFMAVDGIFPGNPLSYEDDFFAGFGGVVFVIGIAMLIAVLLFGGKTNSIKVAQTQHEQVDSLLNVVENKLKKEKPTMLKLVITQSDYNGVFCGRDIQIIGHDELNIGDTLTVNIK